MKTVIQVWTHTVKNHVSTDFDNRWGLGDIIRGTIALYQLCEKHHFSFICDTQLHPTSQCLKNDTPHAYTHLISQNKNDILFFCDSHAMERYILDELKNKDVVYLMTNCTFDKPITNDCKTFMKTIMTPNTHLMERIEIQGKLISDYSVLHYRLGGLFGDQHYAHGNKNFAEYINHLNTFKSENNILITDSNALKQKVKEHNLDLHMFDTQITHLGHGMDKKSVEDTLFEFFIMSMAKNIKYHPKFGPSGFIKAVNYIYDVELIRM